MILKRSFRQMPAPIHCWLAAQSNHKGMCHLCHSRKAKGQHITFLRLDAAQSTVLHNSSADDVQRDCSCPQPPAVLAGLRIMRCLLAKTGAVFCQKFGPMAGHPPCLHLHAQPLPSLQAYALRQNFLGSVPAAAGGKRTSPTCISTCTRCWSC